jgi:hypothetical protein
MVKERAATKDMYSNWKLAFKFHIFYEVVLTDKGSLTWEGMVKNIYKSWRSPFKKALSNDTTFSNINLAGQSLYGFSIVSNIASAQKLYIT